MSFGIPVRNGVGVGLLASTSLSTRNRTGFNPAAVLFGAGEPGGWYDPSDLSTMFQDTAGTVPVTATGQTVARINDKSGRGNHLTQATAASRPQYQIDALGLPYLLFDGTDDWFISPTITPGIDKAQVFAGVRKLSDAAFQAIAETSVDPNSSVGSFSLGAASLQGDASRRTWATVISGSVSGVLGGAFVYPAPDTKVVTLLDDISQASAALETIMHLNGIQQTLSISGVSAGTGNFLAYPLYIGRRGGISNPFNGRIYQMIVRFGANLDAATIAATEAFVNSRTGAYV